MEKQNVYLTREEIAEIEQRLEQLKTVSRAEISEQIKQARAFGDISENAEYDEAKNEQAKIEGEIAAAENLLRTAKLIDSENIDTAAVTMGTTVRVLDVAYEEELVYHIAGTLLTGNEEDDADVRKISADSPVAKALLGKKVGRTASVQAPGGIIKLKILEISR